MFLFKKLFGTSPEDVCDEGLYALDRRDYDAAVRSFANCVEVGRRESTVRIARFHLAECRTQLSLRAWDQGDADAAYEEIERALASTPPTAERHLIAAQIARKLDDRAGVAVHIEAALALIPNLEPAVAMIALHLYEEGRIEEAVAKTEALPGLDGRLRRFHEAHESGDRQTAVAHLAAVAAGYPDSLL